MPRSQHEAQAAPPTTRQSARSLDTRVIQKIIHRIDASQYPKARWGSRDKRAPKVPIAIVANHFRWFIDGCASQLTSVVGDRVSLSIKFLWITPDYPQPSLHTILRSSGTRMERHVGAARNNFAYWENSAFKSLLRDWPTLSHFSFDDLVDRWREGTYENANAGWMDFYNSTSVVAIPQSKEGSALPIGFLCADSLLGRLAENNASEFLGVAAQHIYAILSTLVRGEGRSVHFSTEERIASPVELPVGWRYVNDELVSGHLEEQQKFQAILDRLESFYRPERVAPVIGGQRAPRSEEESVNEDEQFFLETEDPSADGLASKADLPHLTAEELDNVLKRMSAYNPDAALMLRNKREA